MTATSTLSDYADFSHLWLEISPTTQQQAWEQSQKADLPSSRWNAYLNQLVLTTFLDWLQEEQATPSAAFGAIASCGNIWEVVNGSAVQFGKQRLVLIPSEAIDLREISIPQEWVDIPEWVADYYLAVQVNLDEGWIRIWGYTSHLEIKTRGFYQASDRTYHLDEENLIADLNILWVARKFCPEEPTRSPLVALPLLTQSQANDLIERLGNPELLIPRLAIPFDKWGALLSHGGWRQRLYERRQRLVEQWSILQWCQEGLSDIAQQLGWARVEFQPSSLGARDVGVAAPVVGLARPLNIAGQIYELRVLPQDQPPPSIWRFELRNASMGALIPGGFKLRLLTEDLRGFDNNEDAAITAVEQLYIDVVLEPGEALVWETEPIPDNYDREILRF